MRRSHASALVAICLAASLPLLADVLPASAQSASDQPSDANAVPDDLMTLVVGTRFVDPTTNESTAKDQFNNERVAQTTFNDTDHCIDQSALETATTYFETLGRALGKAGHYYFLPDDEVRKAAAICERVHGGPAKAWAPNKTGIIAFGRVVPTTDAPALEQAIR